jgi:polar amino acid transport system substrate-binding protein
MMKIFKRIGLAALALVILGGCASQSDTTPISSQPVSSQAVSTSTLSRILQRGELVVGTSGNMPPLNMKTKGGQIIGLEVDIARFMASAMDVKLTLKDMPFAELLPALESAKVDMVLSGMTMTPERNLKFAFVGPYMVSGKSFLTKKDTIAKARKTSEINNPQSRFAALEGSTSEMFVKEVLPQATLIPTRNYDEAVRMVLKDEVHALVADYPICVVALLQYPDAGFVSVLTPFTYEPIGLALSADDPHLVNWANNFFRIMIGSGNLAKLKQRWMNDGSWLNQLAGASMPN